MNTYNCPVKIIKIGAFNYEIRWMDNADFNATTRHGQHEGDYHVLYIFSGKDVWGMLDTLYHEINHAIEYVFGFSVDRESEDDEKAQKYRTDEQHCTSIATGWVMINRDNPEFREWVNSLYKEEN